jgi:hypothetical protein
MHVLRVQTKTLFTGQLNTMDIPATYRQLECWLDGERLGVAMPDLEPEHIAFLVSGMTSITAAVMQHNAALAGGNDIAVP